MTKLIKLKINLFFNLIGKIILQTRSQCVVIDEKQSKPVLVNSEVP